jgi:hypothetical protein
MTERTSAEVHVSHVEFGAAPTPARVATPAGARSAKRAVATLVGLDGSALGRTVEQELVPRLLLAHRAGPFSPFTRALVAGEIAGATPQVHPDDRHDFLEAVLGADEDAATQLIEPSWRAASGSRRSTSICSRRPRCSSARSGSATSATSSR